MDGKQLCGDAGILGGNGVDAFQNLKRPERDVPGVADRCRRHIKARWKIGLVWRFDPRGPTVSRDLFASYLSPPSMRSFPVKSRVPSEPFVRLKRRVCAIAGVVAIAALAGCQTQGPETAAARPRPAAPEEMAPHQLTGDQPGFLRLGNTPKDHPPVRVGLLLPFSNGSPATRALANAMLNAAQMAVSDAANPDLLLIPADEGSSPADAAKAARKLLAQGAEVIVGPLFAASVTAVTPIARDRGVPVLAFSTDRSVAGKGVYLLSFQPENEIRHIVAYAAAKGRKNFAALVPQNAYGDRVAQAFCPDRHRQSRHVRRCRTFCARR